MAIQYPTAGAIYYTQFACTSIQTMCDGIKDALVSCGWTSSNKKSRIRVVFNGVPSNNQTITVAGQVYTFKTTLSGSADEVLIGASAAACASNLFDAVTDNSGNEGTTYGTGTTANATATAVLMTSTTLNLVSLVGGFSAGSSFTASHGLSNVTMTTGYSNGSIGRGYEVLMPATPAGIMAGVVLEDPNYDASAAFMRIRVMSADFSTVQSSDNFTSYPAAGVWTLSVQGGRSLEFCGNAHQFFVWLLNDSTTVGTKFMFVVPYVRDRLKPSIITAATNASPIQITTDAAHGLATGDDVFIADVEGNTAANGFWTVTYVDSTNVTLDSSTGSGTYTSGGVMAANHQIARAFIAMGDETGTSMETWRTVHFCGGTGNTGNIFVCANQFYYGIRANGITDVAAFKIPQLSASRGIKMVFGLVPDLIEPKFGWPIASSGGTYMEVGDIWGAFIVLEPNVMDRLQTGFNGHNWINFTNSITVSGGGGYSIWLAKT